MMVVDPRGLDVGSSRRSETATVAFTAPRDEPTWVNVRQPNIEPFAATSWAIDSGVMIIHQRGLDVGSSRRSETATVAFTAPRVEPTWVNVRQPNIEPFAATSWAIDSGVMIIHQRGLDMGSSRRSETATVAFTAPRDEPTGDNIRQLNIESFAAASWAKLTTACGVLAVNNAIYCRLSFEY